MSLREELKEKRSALAALKERIEADDAEAIAEGEQLQAEIEAKTAEVEQAEKKAGLLNIIGQKQEEENMTEVKKTPMEELTEKAANMVDKKAGAAVHFKSSTTVVTAPTLTDIDRSVAPLPGRTAVADFFTTATIGGNAVTYFMRGDYEGTPSVVAQGAVKPQNSTSFTPTTLALSKIAAYIKETDEILWDAEFLASEVQNSLVYQLGLVEDSTIISAISGTTGTLGVEVGTGDNAFADAIISAAMAIKNASAYDASVVIINPSDYVTLLTAKDGNNQYYGSGYFAGQYGQGGYGTPTAIWGIPIFTNSNVTSGTAIVAARQAVKIWRKGGLDVKLYEQNEDDAIYNRVTLLAEERLACAVVDLNGVCLVSAS